MPTPFYNFLSSIRGPESPVKVLNQEPYTLRQKFGHIPYYQDFLEIFFGAEGETVTEISNNELLDLGARSFS